MNSISQLGHGQGHLPWSNKEYVGHIPGRNIIEVIMVENYYTLEPLCG